MSSKPHCNKNQKFLFNFLKAKNVDDSDLKKIMLRCFCPQSHSHARLGLDALQIREFHRAYYMIILIVKNLESLKLGYLSSCFLFLQRQFFHFQIFLTFPELLKIVFDLLFFFLFWDLKEKYLLCVKKKGCHRKHAVFASLQIVQNKMT